MQASSCPGRAGFLFGSSSWNLREFYYIPRTSLVAQLVPGLDRSPGEGKGYPLQYSGLENSMDWIVRGVAKGRTRLSDFHFPFHYIPVTSVGML